MSSSILKNQTLAVSLAQLKEHIDFALHRLEARRKPTKYSVEIHELRKAMDVIKYEEGRDVPLDPAADAFLTSIGYVRIRYPESWEDDGDGESGPHLIGGPGFDEYVSDEDTVYVYHGKDGCAIVPNDPWGDHHGRNE